MQIASEIRDSMRGGRAHIYVVGKSLSWTLVRVVLEKETKMKVNEIIFCDY